MDRFKVTYRLSYINEEAKQIANALRIEQTIEFPYELVTDDYIKNEVTGKIEEMRTEGNETVVIISYDAKTMAGEVTQFLNVLFGNSSLLPGIWVEDIELCPSLLTIFKGPQFGISGLRDLINVFQRPLLQAVIKPMGLSVTTLSSMCRAYTKGGADVIKDDHGITNQCYAPFKERVKTCAAAVQEENIKNNTHTLYAANVSADGGEILERAYFAKEAGATALLVAPALVGFSWLHKLSTDPNLHLPIISHPSFMGGFTLPGVSGITRNLWMAMFPRLFGADMSVFVSYGGRFTYTAEDCKEIQHHLVKPWYNILPTCPAPGGGVTAKRLPELINLYGNDTMFLVGGDMFRRGPDLESNMKYFIDMLDRESK